MDSNLLHLGVNTEENCKHILAEELQISLGDNPSYWEMEPDQSSILFPKNIARLKNVCSFDVKGEIVCSLPPGAYAVSWRAHLSANARGWDSEPVHFTFSKNNEVISECKCNIDRIRSGASSQAAQMEQYSLPTIRGVEYGWTEFNVGVFVVEEGDETCALKFSMVATSSSLKSGLSLDGVFLRPKSCMDAVPVVQLESKREVCGAEPSNSVMSANTTEYHIKVHLDLLSLFPQSSIDAVPALQHESYREVCDAGSSGSMILSGRILTKASSGRSFINTATIGYLSEAPSFGYQPLFASGEIRLLHVLRGKGSADIICCEIIHCANLDNPPSYEALSYTWGDATMKTNILCNGKRMSVTSNLAMALRALRQEDCRIVLWVDAVCVNQDDDDEKSKQVSMMRDIYRQAERVVAWVGERHDDDEAVFNVGNYLHLMAKDIRISNEEIITWLSLVTFIKRPWFSRVWIVQELAVARGLTIYCGQRMMEWDILRRGLIKFLERMGLFLNTSKADVSSERVFTLLSIRNLFTEHSEEHQVPESLYYEFPLSQIDDHRTPKQVEAGDLLRFVRGTRLFNSTNPSDHIFAILGLVLEEDSKGVEITHSKDYTYVYKDFVRVMMVQHGTLDVLSQAGLHSTLPSWVPDWTVPLKSYPLSTQAYSASDTKALHNEGNSRLKTIGPEAFQEVLQLRGVVVDTINSLTPGLIVSNTTESEVFEHSALRTFKASVFVGASLTGDSLRKIPTSGKATTVRIKPDIENRWHQAAQLCGAYSGGQGWESACIQTLIGNLPFKQLGPSHDALIRDCFLIWRERLQAKISIMIIVGLESSRSIKVKPELKELFSRYHESWLSGERSLQMKRGMVQVNSDTNHPVFVNKYLVNAYRGLKQLIKSSFGHNVNSSGTPVRRDADRSNLMHDDASVKLGIAKMFARAVERIARNRHFCKTRRGAMGWVPSEALEGDVVCVLEGGRVPYILRPDARRIGLYRFVGEAYIHGLMRGEELVGEMGDISLI